ncbi:hypothetical protein [Pedobacter rhodius]|uniref:Uncharacterized protein n=1 Tax=Pedobacter rhodius TaxID=3004098 RepID=A0ABT4L2P7_9SPHI|nr:hypothetical protein [Pedobacter sp. SJ11]MCZ4225450.1 hypothetical protein [Pedobacter sp. SJ11]
MEQDIETQLKQFRKPLFIINGICLIMGIWFTYKHYFKNDGKGIDEVFYLLSIFTLHSFFGLITLMKVNDTKTCKNWLIVTTIFILLSALFVEIELMKWVSFMMIIPFSTYLLPLFLKNQKTIINLLKASFIFAIITSILPIFAFIMSVISLIIGLLNPA